VLTALLPFTIMLILRIGTLFFLIGLSRVAVEMLARETSPSAGTVLEVETTAREASAAAKPATATHHGEENLGVNTTAHAAAAKHV